MHSFKLVASSLLAVLIAACTSSTQKPYQKPFDQMTAQEHLAAAARESQLAADNFAKINMANIEPPETLASGLVYGSIYEESAGSVPYTYEPYFNELGTPESDIGWPRVSDPSEKYEDAANEHRENAMRHERAAALLEGRPSPQPLPPVQADEQLLDEAG